MVGTSAPGLRDVLGRRVLSISPGDGAVVQRGALMCPLTVETGWRVDRLEVGIGVEAVEPERRALLEGRAPGEFGGAVALAPGWNVLSARSTWRGHTTWTGSWLVGSGEVFVVAGQSNAVGASQRLFRAVEDVRTAELQADGRLRWRTGHDPQRSLGGGSCWPELGRLIAREQGVPVGFVNVAVGSTTIDDWAVGGPLHAELVRALKATRPHGVRAVLWMQGEAPTPGPPDQAEQRYHEGLSALIRSTQSLDGLKPVRWMVARVGSVDHGLFEAHRHAQARLCQAGLAAPGPDLDTFGPEAREADGVHIRSEAQPALARQWLRAMHAASLLPRPAVTTEPTANAR
jgi:hypothetical protein